MFGIHIINGYTHVYMYFKTACFFLVCYNKAFRQDCRSKTNQSVAQKTVFKDHG